MTDPQRFTISDRRLKRVQCVLLAALLCLVTAMPCLAQGAGGKPQLIWFAPRDHRDDNINGSIDYFDLFTASSPWTQAASHVQIFKFYDGSIFGSLTDAQLRQAFADLQRRHILVAVEKGMLTNPADGHCGNTEGFFGENALALATRIKELGGNLDYIAMDEPFQHAVETHCDWTPLQVAENAAKNIASIKSIFPNVKVGDIEIVPDTRDMPDWLTQYAAWFDAWRAATGEPLAFFHADVDWGTDYQPAIDALRQVLEQRQIPFGTIYYNPGRTDQSDRDWVDDARRHYESIETAGNVIPDHVIFQSWEPYPTHVLPESDPTTFTYLIDTYFRTRTGLSASVAAGEVSGRLVDDQLNPVAGAPITVTAEPVSGSGIIVTYTLTGTVPPASTQAVIHVNVNTENGGAVRGTNDMSVYSFAYSDSGNQTMLNFANGLQGWYLNATGSVRAISDANGAGIQISATPDQYVQVSSTFFAVTPGSNYVLTVRARISPSSVGSGNFPLIFLSGGIETTRATLPFVPGKAIVGKTPTKSDGSYSVPYAPPSADPFKIQAEFPGDDTLWPAIGVVGGNLPATTNFQGLWWKPDESGWGINFAHQGDQIFATWYTYDTQGKAWWLSMLAGRATPTSSAYTGTIFVTSGPPFSSYAGVSDAFNVGNGTLTFSDANNGIFTYTVNGVFQTKAITRYDLGTGPQPICTYSTITPNFAAATNYQDLWWVPNGVESGWGVNLAHQGDSLFATWFTYNFNVTPLWLSALVQRQGASNVYAGPIYQNSGPRFDAYSPDRVVADKVGTATFTFADGDDATFGYTVMVAPLPGPVTQAKQITRFPFAASGGTICQ